MGFAGLKHSKFLGRGFQTDYKSQRKTGDACVIDDTQVFLFDVNVTPFL